MTTPIITYKPYSIVVVPFPFTDKLQTKRRPALVLSNESYQHATGHITLLMITSAKHSNWTSDYKIKDLKNTGLNAASIIRQKIFTIDARLIIKMVGKLSTHDIKNLKKIIKNSLAL